MENTQENIGKREAQLRHWGARLDQIVAKAEKVGIEVNAAKRQRVDEARTKYQAAQTKLNEYKAAGSEKWGAFKTGVENAWSDLESAFKKLKD
jgi:hypothetical protein